MADIRYVTIKKPKRQMDWQGMRIRTRREVRTAQIIVPAGAIGTVDYASGGIVSIRMDACPHCGVAARFTFKHVADPNLVEFVEPGMV